MLGSFEQEVAEEVKIGARNKPPTLQDRAELDWLLKWFRTHIQILFAPHEEVAEEEEGSSSNGKFTVDDTPSFESLTSPPGTDDEDDDFLQKTNSSKKPPVKSQPELPKCNGKCARLHVLQRDSESGYVTAFEGNTMPVVHTPFCHIWHVSWHLQLQQA